MNKKLKNKLLVYHTVETVPNANIKIVGEANSIPLTHIHHSSCFKLLSGTSIKSGRIKLVILVQTSGSPLIEMVRSCKRVPEKKQKTTDGATRTLLKTVVNSDIYE